MKKTKFMLVQIIMVLLVGWVFGSTALAKTPDHAKGGKGTEMKNANASEQGKANANTHAGFVNEVEPEPVEEPPAEEPPAEEPPAEEPPAEEPPAEEPPSDVDDCVNSGGTYYDGYGCFYL